MLMAEFITAIKHKLPVKVVINNNNSLGQILWEQMVLGYPEYGVRHPEPFVNYTALATANGAFGVKVSATRGAPAAHAAGAQSRRARAGRRQRQPRGAAAAGEGRRTTQAKKFAEAFLHGQPHKATIATTLFKDKIQQLRS